MRVIGALALSYIALGVVTSGSIVILRGLGGLPRLGVANAISTALLWPIALANRRRAQRMTLKQFEILCLDAAFVHGTTISEQRERLGHLAPPHEFSLNRSGDMRCSICKRPINKHEATPIKRES